MQSLLKADDHHDCLRAMSCQRAFKGFGAGLVPVGFLGAGRKYNTQLSNLTLTGLIKLDTILACRWSGVCQQEKAAVCYSSPVPSDAGSAVVPSIEDARQSASRWHAHPCMTLL